MLCLHYKMTPRDIAQLTMIQYNMLIRALDEHLKREAGQ